MNRPRLELLVAFGAVLVAALTNATVPFADLGPWALGNLGPLAIIGVLVCTRAWPWRATGDSEVAVGPDWLSESLPHGAGALASSDSAQHPPRRWLYVVPAPP